MENDKRVAEFRRNPKLEQLLGELDGLHQEAMTARKLGFVGKLVIHPCQIEVVHLGAEHTAHGWRRGAEPRSWR